VLKVKIIKYFLKKLSDLPPIHLISLIYVLIMIINLINFVFGNIDFDFLKGIFIKSIILLIITYYVYFALSCNDDEEEVSKNEKPEEYFIKVPGKPNSKPDHYGTNIKINVIAENESKKADSLKDAIEKFTMAKKNLDEKPAAHFNEKPKTKPIVEEGKSKAEQEGNTVLNEEGKPIVKPNYKLIASEWVKNNLELLNKICNDAYAISGGAGEYSAIIPSAYLPTEKASWIVIGKTLEAEDDISSFKILKEGLEIIVS
jgi:hypothetical protein